MVRNLKTNHLLQDLRSEKVRERNIAYQNDANTKY